MNPIPTGTKVTDHNGAEGTVILPPAWTGQGYIVQLTSGAKVLRYRAELEVA